MSQVDKLLKRTDIRLLLACYVFFTLFSGIDLWVSSLFYKPELGFWLDDLWFNRFIHATFAKIHLLWLVLLIAGAIYYWKKGVKSRQKAFVFLIVTMVVGPGLFVNVFVKDNSVGRARPVQIEEFGGENRFTPAFIYSGACKKNCSFVSGHSAIGFYAIVLGWVFTSRRWFWGGVGLGAIISLSRMMEGAHFLSDTVFAFWAVYFCTLILGYFFNYPSPFSRASEST